MQPELTDPTLLTPPDPFGYKNGWVAVPSTDPNSLAKALGLLETHQAGWQYGVWHAYSDDYEVFVTPRVGPWVLALGHPIAFEAQGHGIDRLVELSRQFGEAQLFATHRVSGFALWARARDGRLIRLYEHADGNHREIGEQTDEEKAMNLKFRDFSSPEAADPDYWKRKDLVSPDDEQLVMRIAGAWSIDPTKLDQIGIEPAFGLIGQPDSTYPPKPEWHVPKPKKSFLSRLFRRSSN